MYEGEVVVVLVQEEHCRRKASIFLVSFIADLLLEFPTISRRRQADSGTWASQDTQGLKRVETGDSLGCRRGH